MDQDGSHRCIEVFHGVLRMNYSGFQSGKRMIPNPFQYFPDQAKVLMEARTLVRHFCTA